LSQYERAYFETTEFKNDLARSEWQTSTSESNVWFAEHKNSMLKKYKNAFERHEKNMSEYQKIIKPEYGH
jgi:hypothetical protein